MTNYVEYYEFFRKMQDSIALEGGKALEQITLSLWENYTILIVCIIILFFIGKYIERGKGSVYYYLFYFGIPACLVAIFGWSILFRIDFQIVYNASFFLSGILLNQARRKRSYNF